MPIYEYLCRDCGRQFEALVRKGALPDCPDCHSRSLDKQLSVFATAAAPGDLAATACGTCGDPRGPGACRFN